MFERFTERARQVVVFAQDEARALPHNYIGAEHVLLGIAAEGEGVAARILWDFEVDVERSRGEVIRFLTDGGSGVGRTRGGHGGCHDLDERRDTGAYPLEGCSYLPVWSISG